MLRAAILAILASLTLPLRAAAKSPETIACEVIAPLLDPAKVATLKGGRPANPRLYRLLYWLKTAKRAGGDISAIITTAQTAAGYAGTKGAIADAAAIRWTWGKLSGFGCFDGAGMAKLRKGGAPLITQGTHAGDTVALDHVLPIAVMPELAARFYNLEAIPSLANRKNSADITKRELELARRWHRDGFVVGSRLGSGGKGRVIWQSCQPCVKLYDQYSFEFRDTETKDHRDQNVLSQFHVSKGV